MESDSSFSCVIAWTPSTALALSPEFSAISLPEEGRIASFHGTARQSLILDEDAKLWETTVPRKATTGTPVLRLLAGLGSDPVAGMSCNEYVAFAWTKSGQAFVWGIDANEDGIMGLPEVYQSNVPVKIQDLAQTRVVGVAVGKTHAAAVDELEAARIFKSKQVVCGDTFTAVCTTGGYVYIFGVIGSHVQRRRGQTRHSTLLKQLLLNQAVSSRGLSTPRREGHENHPYTFPDISNYFAVAITAGAGFVAILTDDCVPLIADDCMDLVKLPMRDHDQVHVLSAIDRVLYGQTEDMMYEWREPQLQANASALLRNLVAAGRYACPLHTWAGSVFKTDPKLGRVRLDTNQCGGADVSALLAEGVCQQYPFELLITVSPKGREQYAQGLLDAKVPRPESTDPQNFSKVLLQKLKLEQGSRLTSLHAITTARIRMALQSIKSFVEMKRMAVKSREAAIIPTMLTNLLYKLRIARISAGMSSIKRVAELDNIRKLTIEQEKTFARHQRGESIKVIVRVISGAEMLNIKRGAERLFSMHTHWMQLRKRRAAALQALRRIAVRTSATMEKQALHQWSNCIILFHICGEGVERLIASLAKHKKSRSFTKIQAYAGRCSLRNRVLGRIMRRQDGKSAHIALVRTYSEWKSVLIHQRLTRIGHKEAIQTSCKALCGRLKVILRRVVFRETVRRIEAFVSNLKEQSLRLQLVYLFSVLGKVRYRSLNSAFNGLLRLRSDSLRFSDSIAKLQSAYLARTRFAFGQMTQFVAGKQAQRVFRMGLVLSKVGERAQRVNMRTFFHMVNAPTPQNNNASSDWGFETPTGSHSAKRSFPIGLLTKLETMGHWENLSERKDYYCPDDTPAFLSREVDFEYCSKPAELERTPNQSVSPNNRASLQTELKPSESSMSIDKQSSSSMSLQNSPSKQRSLHKRPPWRAPQPTGATQAPVSVLSPRIRRMQYSHGLQLRLHQITSKKSSMKPQPALFSSKPSFNEDNKSKTLPAKFGGISPVTSKKRTNPRTSLSTSPDSTPQTCSKPELPFAVFHVVTSRIDSVFSRLRDTNKVNAFRRQKHLSIGGSIGDDRLKTWIGNLPMDVDVPSLSHSASEPSALLEESWKLRMKKVGIERIRRVMDAHFLKYSWLVLLCASKSH